MNRPLVYALLVLQLAGCASVRTLNAAKPGGPVVYAGARLDWYAIEGGCCPVDKFGAQAPGWPWVDLPASMLLDTLLLPLSLLTAAGVGFQARGGF